MRRNGVLTRRKLNGFGGLLPAGAAMASAPPATTPLTILGSAVKLWLRADLGITIGTGVSAWADQSGNGNDFTQAVGAAQSAFEAAGYSGQASVLADGIDDVLVNTTLAATLPGGTDTPFSLYMPTQHLTAGAAKVAIGAGNSASPTEIWEHYYNSTGPTWSFTKRDDVSAIKTASGGVADLSRHLFEVHCVGTTADIVVDGTLVATAADIDLGAMTVNRLSLFALVRNTISNYANCRIPEVVFANAVSAAGDKTAMRAYFAARYP